MSASLLATYLGLGGTNGRELLESPPCLKDEDKVILDFYYYNYAFCKERRFDACATSTFLSIMKDVFDEVTL